MLAIPEQAGDYTRILQTAIDEVENVQGNREIVLPNTTIVLDGEVMISKDNITIRGGHDTCIMGDGALKLAACNNARLHDLWFHEFDFQISGPCSKVIVRDCDYSATCLSVVTKKSEPVYDLLVEGCLFRECGAGIFASGNVDGIVSRCVWQKCDVAVEMESKVPEEDYLKDYDCVRLSIKDSRVVVPRKCTAFVADSGTPLILDSVRIDGAGDVGVIGLCGKRFTHSLVKVWNSAGYLNVPTGVWVDTSSCDHIKFKHI